jgi:UDP-3-O-[3-hydroxymyristoyl] glucosamine N-acyltransferase
MKHAHLNLQTTIGHDCEIGDYFTTAPGAKISGNCKIHDCIYIGTNASIREKISIHSFSTIGMNAAVVKSIEEPGTYVGVPAIKIS